MNYFYQLIHSAPHHRPLCTPSSLSLTQNPSQGRASQQPSNYNHLFAYIIRCHFMPNGTNTLLIALLLPFFPRTISTYACWKEKINLFKMVINDWVSWFFQLSSFWMLSFINPVLPARIGVTWQKCTIVLVSTLQCCLSRWTLLEKFHY